MITINISMCMWDHMSKIVSEHSNIFRNMQCIEAFTSFSSSLLLFISCNSVHSHCWCIYEPQLPIKLQPFLHEPCTHEPSFIPFQHFLASHFHSSFCPQADLQVARPLAISALNQLYVPVDGVGAALAQRLQPVLILEPQPGLVHSQFVSCELRN